MLTAGRASLPGRAAAASSGRRRLQAQSSSNSSSSKILAGSPPCGAHRSPVSTAAFKRRPADNAPNRGGGAPPRQPGGPPGGGYPSLLPPLDPRDAAGAPPRMQPPQQQPPNGGGGRYSPAGGAPPVPRNPMPPPPPPQQQQFGAAPAAAPAGAPAPPPQQQQPPPQQQQQQQQSGYIQQQPPPPQQQQPGFINPNQSGWGNAPQQQQPGFIRQPPQQQQAWGNNQGGGGFNNSNNRGQQQQQQQVQYPPPPQQQKAFDPEKGGYLTDAGNFMGGGYMSQNSGNNAGTGWQGGYVNTQPQRRQNSNYNNGDRWSPGGGRNNSFTGFTDDWADPNMTTNFLLSQLSSLTNGGEVQLDDWAVVDDEEDYDDTTPKFVNSKRVLLNRELADKGIKKVRVQSAEKEDLGVMTLDAAMEQARELARAMTEQSQVAATAQLATRRPEDMPMPGAVRKSIKARVDVVLINDAGDPPVVRLVDFSKYKYDLEKTAKAKQKASKGPETKEVKLRPVTEKADYETKVRSAQKFLSKGAKVKLTMTFSGREMRFKDQGKEMMLKLIDDLADVSKLDAPLALRPSNFSVTLSPLK